MGADPPGNAIAFAYFPPAGGYTASNAGGFIIAIRTEQGPDRADGAAMDRSVGFIFEERQWYEFLRNITYVFTTKIYLGKISILP
jgi:hypothetical protein